MTDSTADQTPAAPPVQVLRGDMLETLRAMPADRFHAVVTDPPYGLSEPLSGDDAAAVLAQWILEGEYHRTKGRKKPATPGFDAAIGPRLTGGGFLGASWDAFVPSPAQWAEVLRVLRPGGYALVFAGTRTAGWMAISLMLAGFEILDQVTWMYGQGFAKSGDVSKRIDKALGAEREVVGEREVAADRCPAVGRQAVEAGASSYVLPVTAPATDEAARWEDWSTTLKPAHEPIIVVRKPLRAKSVGANLLAWQAGALNIGACRIATSENLNGGAYARDSKKDLSDASSYAMPANAGEFVQPEGRWPANVVLSHSPACGDDPAACAPGCAAAALDEQGGDRVSGSWAGQATGGGGPNGHLAGKRARPYFWTGDAGGASRFFYCAKASRADRECGLEDLPEDHDLRKKGHPTVKPTALMRWLVRLVCPPAWRDEAAGEVLDPFGGSGSTGVALALEGFRGVLVERDERFAEIATRRVARAVGARASGEVPKPWREKKPKPLERKGCADACPVATLDEQSGYLAARGNLTAGAAKPIAETVAGFAAGIVRDNAPHQTYDEGGGASRFFATFVADPADVSDEQIARYEATIEGAPSPEEVAEARAVAGAAAAILADPAADPDARAWAERDLRARDLLADEFTLAPVTHEPGETPEEVAAAAGAREVAAEPPAPAERPPLACREVAQGVEIVRPAEGADALGAALLAAGAVEVEPVGWLVPWDALDAADAALVAGGWALAGPAQEAA